MTGFFIKSRFVGGYYSIKNNCDFVSASSASSTLVGLFENFYSLSTYLEVHPFKIYSSRDGREGSRPARTIFWFSGGCLGGCQVTCDATARRGAAGGGMNSVGAASFGN